MSAVVILSGLSFGVWVYAFISALNNTFKNDINKLIWIVVLIFIPISAILYFFISPNQIEKKDQTENLEYAEVAKALILKTNNELKAIEIINKLKKNQGEITEEVFKQFIDSDTKLSHSNSDGYYKINSWTPEISNAINTLSNKELYLEPIHYRFGNKSFYFILFLIDKKHKWI